MIDYILWLMEMSKTYENIVHKAIMRVMLEERRMTKVEFIESYIKVGNDYQWHDNHGELIRCKDCRHYTGKWCTIYSTKQFDINDIYKDDDDFCSHAERREK